MRPDPYVLVDKVWITDVVLDEYSVRGVLVVDEERALVWDTLSHPRDMTGHRDLSAGRELTIVYSHADWDHIWGTAGLPYASSTVVGHRLCHARFDADVPVTLREKQLAEPGAWDAVSLVPPTTMFDAEMVVALGEVTIHLQHLPGHTPDSIVGFVPARGLLLMGDAAETPFPVLPADCPIDRWIAGLERWAHDSRVRMVVPAHGAIGGPEILLRNIDYLSRLRDGRAIEIAEPLTTFYQQTHETNLRRR